MLILGPGTKTHDIYGNGYLQFSSNNTVNGNINILEQVGNMDKGNGITVKRDIISGNNVITRSNNSYNIHGNVSASGNVENSNLADPDQPVSPNVPNFGQYKKINSKVPLHIYQIGSDDIKSNIQL